jgi:hypothetical protein
LVFLEISIAKFSFTAVIIEFIEVVKTNKIKVAGESNNNLKKPLTPR